MTFPDTHQPQAEPAPDAPAFNLATAKQRLAIDNDSQDANVQYALDMALAVAERYCDRRFAFKAETVRYVDNRWPNLLVRRWPIEEVTACTVVYPAGAGTQTKDIDPEDLAIDHERGKVSLQPVWGARTWGAYGWRANIELTYSGGYKTMPPDLQQALWMIFDEVWAATPGMGAEAGASGAIEVKQFAIDGMSLTFGTGSEETAGGQAGGAVGPWGPFLPLAATSLLQWYRAETVMGAA